MNALGFVWNWHRCAVDFAQYMYTQCTHNWRTTLKSLSALTYKCDSMITDGVKCIMMWIYRLTKILLSSWGFHVDTVALRKEITVLNFKKIFNLHCQLKMMFLSSFWYGIDKFCDLLLWNQATLFVFVTLKLSAYASGQMSKPFQSLGFNHFALCRWTHLKCSKMRMQHGYKFWTVANDNSSS